MKTLTALVLSAGFTGLLSAQTLSNYQFIVTGQGPTAYFKLDSSLASSVDPGVVLSPYVSQVGGFAADIFRNPNLSYYFSGQSDYLLNNTTNLINGGGVTNMTSTKAGSITFLFRTLDPGQNTGQRFLFSAGNVTSNRNALSLFLRTRTLTTVIRIH